MSDTVLKGGISYSKYVWHASYGSCEVCQELDGKEYEYEGSIPDQPHPNCKCYIEVIENGGGNGGDDVPCDCVEQLNIIIVTLEEIIGDAESLSDEMQIENQNLEKAVSNVENIIIEFGEHLNNLREEYGQHTVSCEDNIDSLYDEILAKKDKLENLLQEIEELFESLIAHTQAIYFFISNYVALLYEAYALKETGMDKFRHSVANCQSAQLGELGEKSATALSDFKEEYDQYQSIYARTHKVSEEEALADSERDQIANRLGRERGRNNPTCDCHILMQDLKPQKRK